MIEPLKTFRSNVERIVNRKLRLEQNPVKDGTQIEVHFPGNPLELKMILPEKADCVVVDKVVPGRPQTTKKVFEEMYYLGNDLGAGSVLVADGQDTIAEELWESTQYQKQYYLPLANQHTAGTADFDGLVNSRVLDNFQPLLEKTLGIPVKADCYMDERPYILSMDYQGPSEDGKEPPFHMYIHMHELTGSLYVEEIELPEELRGKGYGSKFVDYMKWFSNKFGFAYMYLEAAVDAERFWERHGFEYLYRLNLRKQWRRERTLKRRPGWERSWVGTHRLQQPVWQYRSHPHDDFDLIAGLLVHEREWDQLKSIAV